LQNEDIDVLIAAYQGGMTLDELASAFAVEAGTAAKLLERRGVARRGRKVTDKQVAEAAELYRAGWSLSQLGERYGVYTQSMGYRLKRAGVTLRPRPGWPATSQ
jgi:hypothetical protein